MNNLKKILSLALACMMLLSLLAGCGGQTSGGNEPSDSTGGEQSKGGSSTQGSEITIDGIVQYNGVDTGWYRLHGGSCGYLLADYVSTTPITAETLGITLTDERHTLRTYDDSQRTYIWKATDGNWYDGSGQQYIPISDTDWICKASGSSSNWTLIPDDSSLSDSQVSNTVTVSDEDGLNAQTLYHDSATGNWYNIAGGIYTDNGDGTFTGSDGAIWTVTP